MTQPSSPTSKVTSTRDFSGTNPSTAGSAAISVPGVFEVERRDALKVVMGRTSQWHPPRSLRAPPCDLACGRMRPVDGASYVHARLTSVGMQDGARRRTPVPHGFHAGVRPRRHRFRSWRTEGRHRRRQARQVGRRHRTRPHARRRLRQHRHHPVEDAARGGRLPHRHEPARAVRRQLPRQGEDHARRPAGPHPARHRQGDRRRAHPADAQPRRAATSDTPASSTRTPCRSRIPTAAEKHHRHRPTTSSSPPAPSRCGPAGVEFDESRVLDSDGILDLKSHSDVDGGRRRRRHRHRVRVDVRRAGHQGDRRREARRPCSTSATPRSSRPCASTCATSR